MKTRNITLLIILAIILLAIGYLIIFGIPEPLNTIFTEVLTQDQYYEISEQNRVIFDKLAELENQVIENTRNVEAFKANAKLAKMLLEWE